jgi:translation initiation factor IF-3
MILRVLKRVNKEKEQSTVLINEKIRAPQVQLITHSGENIGVVSRTQALKMAQEENLDLVLISQQGKDGVPVAKIMDFGKSLYEKKKKHMEAKKHQKVIHVKEIKLSPKIGEHDYQTKIKQAIQFLKEGKRVKMTLFFRGRENATKEERGEQMFERITESLETAGFAHNLVQEKDGKIGQIWSRIYYLKTGK